MALEISPSGALSPRAPFPSDGWYKFNRFELQDESVISLYRNGNEFKYKYSGLFEEGQQSIECVGDPDDFMEQLIASVPIKAGNKVSFIQTRLRSQVDATVELTRDLWAVTLMSMAVSLTKLNLCDFGHSFILVERINEFGVPEILRIHIAQKQKNPRKGFVYAEVRSVVYDEEWEASDTYLRPAHLVQQMINTALQYQKDSLEALEEGRPSPILYDAITPNPSEGIHNCLSWTLPLLEIADISHPITEYWAPGSNYFVPSYHVKPLKTICKRLLNEKDRVSSILSIEDLSDIAKGQRYIDIKKKELRKEIAGIIPLTILSACLPVAGWLLIPPILIGMPIMCAYHGYEINKMEKALEKKKIKNLELTIKK